MGFAEIPREVLVTADVLRALSLVLSFMPGQKESTKKSGVAQQLCHPMTFTAILQPYCMSVHQIRGSKVVIVAYFTPYETAAKYTASPISLPL